MMIRTVVACAIAALALGACDQQRPATSEEFPVIDAPNRDYSIGPNGAAGITTALPMTVEAVRAAAANYNVAEVQDQVEGQPFTAITLSTDEEVFRINPTHDNRHIHSIVTRSTQAQGPNGEVVTQSTFAQAPAAEVAVCVEDHQGSGEFGCSTAEDGRFWRIYESGPLRRPDGKLVEMRWIAPRVE